MTEKVEILPFSEFVEEYATDLDFGTITDISYGARHFEGELQPALGFTVVKHGRETKFQVIGQFKVRVQSGMDDERRK